MRPAPMSSSRQVHSLAARTSGGTNDSRGVGVGDVTGSAIPRSVGGDTPTAPLRTWSWAGVAECYRVVRTRGLWRSW